MQAAEYARMYEIEESHWWYAGMRATALALLDAAAGPSSANWRILDAGCGTGGMLTQLAGRGSASGVDMAGIALHYCRRRGLHSLAQSSVENLPFRDQSFDLITCMDVLYHVNVAREELALQEFYRVLRPAGWLLVQVPAFESLRGHHDLEVYTRHRYTAPELRSEMEDAGFEAIRLSYANSLLFPAAAAKRLAERRLPVIRWLGSDLMPMPGWLNGVLREMLGLERRLMTHVSFPVGLSVMALVRKP